MSLPVSLSLPQGTTVRMRNNAPDMSTMSIAVPNENVLLYVQPPTIPPSAAFSPMPGACASGILANNAIKSVPISAPSAVAINTDDHSGLLGSSPTIWLGLTVSMYAIARNVAIPAKISVPTVEPDLLIPKNLSNLPIFLPGTVFAAVAASPEGVPPPRS